jgi:hypothetical protein
MPASSARCEEVGRGLSDAGRGRSRSQLSPPSCPQVRDSSGGAFRELLRFLYTDQLDFHGSVVRQRLLLLLRLCVGGGGDGA